MKGCLQAGGTVSSDSTSSKQGLPLRDARSEARISAMEPVQLSSLDQPSITEPTRTQNITSHGARVMTQRIWAPGSRLLIRSLLCSFWAQAHRSEERRVGKECRSRW